MFALLSATRLYFTVRPRGIQRKLPLGIRLSIAKESAEEQKGEKQISSYSALATALAATIGTGNIVGIATAIAIGGPGAVFWCWITGFLGIATCYAECILSVKYKVRLKNGMWCGGPMYVLERGVKNKGMAVFFAVSTILASFGVGSGVQAQSIQTAVAQLVEISPHVVGIIVAVLVGVVILGGNRIIAKVCTWLVPVMSVLYMAGCMYILVVNRDVLPETIIYIVKSAFCEEAAVGGATGGTVMLAMRTGILRGLFTNEAGLGSIPMAAATAETKDALRQGLISMTGPFWDTVVMCAFTGIAIVSSMQKFPLQYVDVPMERICFVSFSQLPMYGEEILAIALAMFAFATILGWNVYGLSATRYLWGEKGVRIYQVGYLLFAYLGAVLTMDIMWGLSDLFNMLMLLPNVYSLFVLRDEVLEETKKLEKIERNL